MEPTTDEIGVAGRRRVGRPRKWASDAERKRAYRERLAADLDEPLVLRRDLRTERRRTAGLSQENARLRKRLEAAERRTADAEWSVHTANGRMRWFTEQAERDNRRSFELIEQVRELNGEVERLRSALDGAPEHPPVQPGVLHAPPGQQIAWHVRMRPEVRPCFVSGCRSAAVSRVQGPRGVERDACADHERPDRQPKRWRVIRRY